jgi:hypothetical protein
MQHQRVAQWSEKVCTGGRLKGFISIGSMVLSMPSRTSRADELCAASLGFV